MKLNRSCVAGTGCASGFLVRDDAGVYLLLMYLLYLFGL